MTTEVIRLPDQLAGDDKRTVALSPYDIFTMGRAIPMAWFFAETLDVCALLDALRTTLPLYPVLCGRYDASPPTSVVLNNAGISLERATAEGTASEAASHLLTDEPSIFVRTAHEPFVPAKEGMDPDRGSPEAPLLSLKLTTFAGGGTAIGVLAQHGVVDADSMIRFMAQWSLAFRGQPLLPTPVHERCFVPGSADAASPSASEGAPSLAQRAEGDKPADLRVDVSPAGEQRPPPFARVMPLINGAQSCVVPFAPPTLAAMKSAASALLPPGAMVSTDDVLTAHLWKALCRMRCAQLDLDVESAELSTTCSRASNFRKRTEPPLADGYCGNAVCQVWTSMSVRELHTTPAAAVAQQLRATLQAHTASCIAARARWLNRMHRDGFQVRPAIDEHALTFIVSSWRFDWESASFGDAPPICFDHGALVPLVANIVPRPKGGGLNVYASGPQASLEQLGRLLRELQDQA
jgi:shikimate O-hydroxycinnamoyltransferase